MKKQAKRGLLLIGLFFIMFLVIISGVEADSKWMGWGGGCAFPGAPTCSPYIPDYSGANCADKFGYDWVEYYSWGYRGWKSVSTGDSWSSTSGDGMVGINPEVPGFTSLDIKFSEKAGGCTWPAKQCQSVYRCIECGTNEANCNKQGVDGCEVYLKTDENNCGSCGNKCYSGYTCINGVCTPPPRYTCNENYQCVQDPSGQYSSLPACEAECYPITTNCDSCESCSEALNNAPAGTTVKLTQNIIDERLGNTICIDLSPGEEDVIFDCQGYSISGLGKTEDTGINIFANWNPTVRNCIINNFRYGISTFTGGTKIINNIIEDNYYGIWGGGFEQYWSYIEDNTIKNNDYGFYLQSGGSGVSYDLKDNYICNNIEYDTVIGDSWYQQAGDLWLGTDNWCDNYYLWYDKPNVLPNEGCTLPCTGLERIGIYPSEANIKLQDYISYNVTAHYPNKQIDVTLNDLTAYVKSNDNVEQLTPRNKFRAKLIGETNITAHFPMGMLEEKEDTTHLTIWPDTNCEINIAEIILDCGGDICEIGENIKLNLSMNLGCQQENINKIKIYATDFDECELWMSSDDLECEEYGMPTKYNCTGTWDIESIEQECYDSNVGAIFAEAWQDDNFLDSLSGQFGSFQFWGPTCEITSASITPWCKETGQQEGDGQDDPCGDEWGDKIFLEAEFENCPQVDSLEITVEDGDCSYPMTISCGGSANCSGYHILAGTPKGCENDLVVATQAKLFYDNQEIATGEATGLFYFGDLVLDYIDLIPNYVTLFINNYIEFDVFAYFVNNPNPHEITFDDLTSYELEAGETRLEQDTIQKNKFWARAEGTEIPIIAKYPMGYPHEEISEPSHVDIYGETDCEILNAKAAAKCGDDGCRYDSGDYIESYVIVNSVCIKDLYMDRFKMLAWGDGCEVEINIGEGSQNNMECESYNGNYNCSGQWIVDSEHCQGSCEGIPDIRDGAHVTTKLVEVSNPNRPLDSSYNEVGFGGFSFWPIIDRVRAVINMPENNEILDEKTVIFNASKSYYIDEYSQHVYCPDAHLDFTWKLDGQTFQGEDCEAEVVYHQYSQPKNNYQVTLEAEYNGDEDEVTHNFKIKYCIKDNAKFFSGDCKLINNQGYRCTDSCFEDICMVSNDCHSGGECRCGSNLYCNQNDVCSSDPGASECEEEDNPAACLAALASCYWDYNEDLDPEPPSHFEIPPKCKHCDDNSNNPDYDYGSLTCTHCSNYVDPSSCEADHCFLGNEEHGDCPLDFSCSNYECTWDSLSSACKLVYDKTPEGQGSQQQCHESRTYGDCVGGYMNVEITTECCSIQDLGSPTGNCDPMPTSCSFGTGLHLVSCDTTTYPQPCGIVTRALPGFGWLNFIIVIFLISVYYVIYVIFILKKR